MFRHRPVCVWTLDYDPVFVGYRSVGPLLKQLLVQLKMHVPSVLDTPLFYRYVIKISQRGSFPVSQRLRIHLVVPGWGAEIAHRVAEQHHRARVPHQRVPAQQ